MMALLAAGRLRARRGDPDAMGGTRRGAPDGRADRHPPAHRAGASGSRRGRLARRAIPSEPARRPRRRTSWPWPSPTRGTSASSPGGRRRPAGRSRIIAARPSHGACSSTGGGARPAQPGSRSNARTRPLGRSSSPTDVDEILEAHAEFDRLGARPAAAMAARRLRELGAPVVPRGRRPTTRANAAGLTARELDVLQLLTRGLPNHEIATHGCTSHRGRSTTTSPAVLGKLGVTRRADAAAAAAQAGHRPPERAGRGAQIRQPPPMSRRWWFAELIPRPTSGRRGSRGRECRGTWSSDRSPRASSSPTARRASMSAEASSG